ncbi:large neutral amino acids transporter small subunit 1-like [Saccoglossus kowalevskii]|uniref:Large neutral amino acids transporter small subunit 1-like n=1 Tax=Saccoglossus kowalevskii TaxID=10224 RepID=A0ABM0LVY7_SACKO|nr:PREDICTED: large neutral amino acids transporter small subunit 1-like [Saccoglossus kowalevskii]
MSESDDQIDVRHRPSLEKINDDDEGSEDAVAMKRQLSLFNSITLIIGSIIGSGIFISPKGVLGVQWFCWWCLIVWSLCGVIATMGGMCYAELGSSIRKGGGEYTYLNEAFGEILAFLMLWVNFVIVTPGNTAIIAQTFATYAIVPFYADCDPPPWAITLVAEACIVLVFAYNCYSVRGSTAVQDVFTVAKVGGLMIIIVGGIVFLFMGYTEYLEDAFKGPGTNVFRLSLAFYNGLFAYVGWASMNNMAEEIVNPRRNFPIAAISSMTIITVIYVMTNIAYFTILSPQEMLASDAVAITWGELALGPLAWLMPVAVAMSTFGAVNGTALSSSRYVFVGARDRLLPTLLSMIHINYLTPLPTLIAMMLITGLLCLYQDTSSLINYTGFSYWLFVGIVTTGLMWLRYKRPHMERPFKVPIIIPDSIHTYLLFLGFISIFAAPFEAVIGTIIILTGIPIYFYGVVWKNKPTWLRRFLDGSLEFLQRLMFVVQQEKATY